VSWRVALGLVYLMTAVGPRRAPAAINVSRSAPTVERGGFHFINDAAAVTPDDMWGVGRNGLLHYDGANWKLARLFDVGTDWASIDISGDVGWAVGGCATLHLVKGEWTHEALPWRCRLTEVQVVGSQAWAAGSVATDGSEWSAFVIHFDGDVWTAVASPPGGHIDAMFMMDNSRGWFANFDRRTQAVQIMEWTDDGWRTSRTGLDFAVRAIHGRSASDVWAVGGIQRVSGSSRQVMLHYDGREWSIVVNDATGIAGSLTDVRMVGDTSGWAVGEYFQIYRFDGSEWSMFYDGHGIRFDDTFSAIVVASASDVWFTGPARGFVRIKDGAYSFWAGIRGTREPLELYESGITGVDMITEDEGWAVGAWGAVIHRTTAGWREVVCDVCDNLTGVFAMTAVDVWAWSLFGNGWVVHFDGERWERLPVPSDLPIRKIRSSDGGLWLIAAADDAQVWRSEILQYDGTEWRRVIQLDDTALYDVDTAGRQVWSVGGRGRADGLVGGVLVRLIGDEWVREDVAATGALRGISIDADGVGWVIAWRSVYRVAGGVWHSEAVPLETAQDGFYSVKANDRGVWIAGEYSSWERSSGVWQRLNIPHLGQEPYRMIAVDVPAKSNAVWFAGAFETIVRFEGTVESTATPPAVPPTTTPDWTPRLRRVVWLPWLVCPARDPADIRGRPLGFGRTVPLVHKVDRGPT
jgi:hypothetical protein